MPGSGRQILIAANPNSGATESGPRVTALNEGICSSGYQSQVIYDLQEIAALAPKLHAEGQLRAVIAAGGDGTADALANLLPHDIPLQLFPLGTENLLARYLGIKSEIDQAVGIIQTGISRQIDVGQANDKVFLVMASIGFDALVVKEMDAIRKGHINRWSYTKPILRAISKYRFPQLKFQVRDSERAEFRELDSAAWGFVFNVPRYAASLEFCPQADPEDGLLDLCQFSTGGLFFGAGYLTRLFFRKHQSMKGFSHAKFSEMKIEAVDGSEVPFQIDGDPGGLLPLHIKTLSKRLTLLVPG